jgi:hypothetical protein
MYRYCVNKQAQPNGDHEVHREGCIYWPSAENRQDLGPHSTCASAVTAAKRYYAQSNGCATCSSACHTS